MKTQLTTETATRAAPRQENRMSAVNNTVSAYAAPGRAGAGALWADKARLRRVLMIGGVGIFLVVAGAVYLPAAAMSARTIPMSTPTS